MKTDRELLELAAKAAGYQTKCSMNTERKLLTPPVEALMIFEDGTLRHTGWNPLESSSDAFDLAVKLKIHISGFFDKVTTDTDYRAFCEMYKGDPYAATRRAIVRAAAQIGETL